MPRIIRCANVDINKHFEPDTNDVHARSCCVADSDWQLGRVYSLAFLNPSRGQPDPALAARLASRCRRR